MKVSRRIHSAQYADAIAPYASYSLARGLAPHPLISWDEYRHRRSVGTVDQRTEMRRGAFGPCTELIVLRRFGLFARLDLSCLTASSLRCSKSVIESVLRPEHLIQALVADVIFYDLPFVGGGVRSVYD